MQNKNEGDIKFYTTDDINSIKEYHQLRELYYQLGVISALVIGWGIGLLY